MQLSSNNYISCVAWSWIINHFPISLWLESLMRRWLSLFAIHAVLSFARSRQVWVFCIMSASVRVCYEWVIWRLRCFQGNQSAQKDKGITVFFLWGWGYDSKGYAFKLAHLETKQIGFTSSLMILFVDLTISKFDDCHVFTLPDITTLVHGFNQSLDMDSWIGERCRSQRTPCAPQRLCLWKIRGRLQSSTYSTARNKQLRRWRLWSVQLLSNYSKFVGLHSIRVVNCTGVEFQTADIWFAQFVLERFAQGLWLWMQDIFSGLNYLRWHQCASIALRKISMDKSNDKSDKASKAVGLLKPMPLEKKVGVYSLRVPGWFRDVQVMDSYLRLLPCVSPHQDETSEGLLQLISDVRGVSLQARGRESVLISAGSRNQVCSYIQLWSQMIIIIVGMWCKMIGPPLPQHCRTSRVYPMCFLATSLHREDGKLGSTLRPQVDPASLNEVRTFLLDHEAGWTLKMRLP